MPLVISESPVTQISLDEFFDTFRAANVKAGDDASLLSHASLLARLYPNRKFLADVLISRLEAMWGEDYRATATSQTVNLGDLGNGHYLRMVFWPSRTDEFFERCDSSVFYYGRPHDHNFSFLTLGYDGPGYDSDYYVIDEDTSNWHPGSPAALESTGRKRLNPGEIMFYQRHVDVHSQLPPDENSISINIMGVATRGTGGHQFIFDEDCKSVQHIMQNQFNPIIFDMAAALDSEQTERLATEIAIAVDNDYVRFYAERFLLKRKIQRDGIPTSRGSKPNNTWINSYLRKATS